MQKISWTGGTPPNPPSETTNAEYALASQFFREDIQTYRVFWRGDFPPKAVLRIYWHRARYDAHATVPPTEDILNTLELIGNFSEWLEDTQAKLKAARIAARKLSPSYEKHALLSQIESLKKDEKTWKSALAGLNEKLASF